MSAPLKMMYSYTSSLGATGLSVGRSSVPNDRTIQAKIKGLVLGLERGRNHGKGAYKLIKHHYKAVTLYIVSRLLMAQ